MRYGFLIIFLFNAIHLQGQQQNNYTFRHIGKGQIACTQQCVWHTAGCQSGYPIWILTPNGLQRYDGTRFINYVGIMNNAATGITDRAELYADNKKNEVWVLKNEAIEKLNLSNNRFTDYETSELVNNSSLSLTVTVTGMSMATSGC